MSSQSAPRASDRTRGRPRPTPTTRASPTHPTDLEKRSWCYVARKIVRASSATTSAPTWPRR